MYERISLVISGLKLVSSNVNDFDVNVFKKNYLATTGSEISMNALYCFFLVKNWISIFGGFELADLDG